MEKEGKFDPTIYRNKDLITVKTQFTGIRSIYIWCPDFKKYVPRKKGFRYCAHVKVFGYQKEKYFLTMAEAIRWRSSGAGVNEEADKFLFSEVMDKYFEHAKTRVNTSTLKTYMNSTKHLHVFFGMPVSSINTFTVDQWLAKIKKPAYLKLQHETRFTYAKELKVLKQILKYYSEYMSTDYVMPIKQRHNKDAIVDLHRLKEAKAKNANRYLTSEETVRFIQSFKRIAMKSDSAIYLCHVAIFQLQVGARIGEACALSWEDVDFNTDLIYISKSVQWGRGKDAQTVIQPFTKTGEVRKVPMTTALKEMLSALKIRSNGKGLVFSQDGVNPFSYRSIQHYYNRAFKEAGVQRTSTHILRHTFSTDYLTATKDHLSLSRILGHASTRQTEHYAKITGILTKQSFLAYQEANSENLGKVLNFEGVAG